MPTVSPQSCGRKWIQAGVGLSGKTRTYLKNSSNTQFSAAGGLPAFLKYAHPPECAADCAFLTAGAC
jgi:hypothetical protein